MRTIVAASQDGTLKADLALLVSNNRTSAALEWAAENGLPHLHLSPRTVSSEDALDQAHLDALKEAKVDLIVLAGYMRKIGPKVLTAYANRILNIHPALLPKYGGQGMYGGRVHEAVIANGDSESGVTVHLVDGEYDTGPVVAQAKVPVLPNDTADELAKRVLAQEHRLYTDTLIRIVAGEINLDALR
ncbi:MAG: phosphoribosylglycinamide formyltransferase [Rhodospirillaceae bacterium]|jgi:phosphoribosylglycinamide formyltransferase-1|nr:phosphoribosylglycinamide formyltransferase [Rhodospirillaceae bacterium]MBT5565256.1 phosphoribosylglycinamide formyltransferase [Rhodospirillaceae bacterium]MBT6091114.1 phosphoribosylglycinamide formyltransferase [Rhodospirillaceae bacterium]MBT6960525.1 phosphoribosylglycinamide formyltransferase [Rhodospirillaceae bacterium]MBT7450993.1 phosphoribosylglycinamide formyltransferase [Rhodospirillaceae bacterium]